MLSDRFHDGTQSHAYCSAGFKCKAHPSALLRVNTSQSEQKNSQLRKRGSAMSFLSVMNFVYTATAYFGLKNKLKELVKQRMVTKR